MCDWDCLTEWVSLVLLRQRDFSLFSLFFLFLTTSQHFWKCKVTHQSRKDAKSTLKMSQNWALWFVFRLLFGTGVVRWFVRRPSAESGGVTRLPPRRCPWARLSRYSLQGCCRITDPARWGVTPSGISKVLKDTFLWLSNFYWHSLNCSIYDGPHQSGNKVGKTTRSIQSCSRTRD